MSAGLKEITTVDVDDIGVAVGVASVGSALGALVGWLTSQLESLFHGGDCDGTVAFELYSANGKDLYEATLNAPYETITGHPGTDPGHLKCRMSKYDVSWAIAQGDKAL